jgi:A/G-specific adenine glycosylase
METNFTQKLMRWNASGNHRKLPWKGEKNVYRIWLSEIILQQTRVEQGREYYKKFILAYPTLQSLAAASDEKVYKLWEGLGYYSRCRNLLHTARFIQNELGGRFPDNYEDLRKLKGIGDYTAAAMASFAYNEPRAVVDGNVFRVLSRVSGYKQAVDSPAGKKYIKDLAHTLLDKKRPGIYNQAIMDFGATVCKPALALCSDCPFKKNCYALTHEMINQIPVKLKKPEIMKRWFIFFDLRYENKIAITKREGEDIWKGLYELPMKESKTQLTPGHIRSLVKKTKWLRESGQTLLQISTLRKQQLTHQLIGAIFIRIKVMEKMPVKPGWKWVPLKNLKAFAFPVIIKNYLDGD